ncbi:Response regulator receiver domain protein [Legionella massiliensis]|uniref:Response regulator receiver domain protein n=1 Tax=Legionella massiliensis TaxID=1034943 RepID=A0A078L5I6_9GAMM|nr:response regulator [Legionella massiliensis]CDZ79193.1 Response regulator receiver domain protein [Legionella massiliensis]CEE14931.1 Response regulator receiver domain protein [Legionella massiliensis]
MAEDITRQGEILIVLVEDDPHHRKKMKDILTDSFPNCVIKTIANGVEACNYLLNPVNHYNLVILDGRLDTYPTTLLAKVNGPDVAEAMRERNIDVPIVLWTNDPKMLQSFDEVCGMRLPEIEKPCRSYNVEAVLTPIITKITQGIHAKQEEENDKDEQFSLKL